MNDTPAVTCLLGLGTNLGDRERNLRRAHRMLTTIMHVTATSPVYETPPWGMTDQPLFLNACLAGQTDLAPGVILAACGRIERELGRQPGARWGPRLIDIDLLFYGDAVLDEPGLTVPHPRLAERAFVLRPLADIAAAFVHPTLGLTVAELLDRVDSRDIHPISKAWPWEDGIDG